MKVIIAGSRSITNPNLVRQAMIDSGFRFSEIVSGGARGVDKLGENLGIEIGVPIKRFLADWKQYGKSAGIIRNKEMAEYADALIAVWDGKSRGTKNMVDAAKKRGLKVFVSEVE